MKGKNGNTLKLVALVAAAGLGVYFVIKNFGNSGSTNNYRPSNYNGNTNQNTTPSYQGGSNTANNDINWDNIQDKWDKIFDPEIWGYDNNNKG